MELTLAHYRNRFCMYRTYYALGAGTVEVEGVDLTVVELPDPPSKEQEEALIRGDVDVANLYLPNFLRRKLQGAPIVGLATEWKSTDKGNGLFVLSGGPVTTPQDLEGRVIGSHQGVHAFHQYLLRHAYDVDVDRVRWEAHRQEDLLDALLEGRVDAVVLLDQFFVRGEEHEGVECLYSDGRAWFDLTGYDEMIKHMVATREGLLEEDPSLKDRLLTAFRASFAYSEEHLDEVADAFIASYGGDRHALITSARYPRVEFTFTEQERRIATAEMEALVEMGQLPHTVDVGSLFAR
jgi:ABC-type nitrate/sulfonate/bicarbonate transport system substrate-binding protein